MKSIVSLGVCLMLPTAASAQERSTLSLLLENDSFINQNDLHYTNGLYVAWTGAHQSRDDTLSSIAGALMLPAGAGLTSWRTSFFGGQSMFTPENLDAHVPPANDRPYAGWLYGGARLYRDGDGQLRQPHARVYRSKSQ